MHRDLDDNEPIHGSQGNLIEPEQSVRRDGMPWQERGLDEEETGYIVVLVEASPVGGKD